MYYEPMPITQMIKKLMNTDYNNFGSKLRQLAIMFNSKYKVEVNILKFNNIKIYFSFYRN